MITGSLDTLQRTPCLPPEPYRGRGGAKRRTLAARPLGKQEVDGLMLFCLVSED